MVNSMREKYLTSFSMLLFFFRLCIFFCKAAAKTALPLTKLCSEVRGEGGRLTVVECAFSETGNAGICFFGVVTPETPLVSRPGYWTFLVSSLSSVTHSSNRLLTETRKNS